VVHKLQLFAEVAIQRTSSSSSSSRSSMILFLEKLHISTVYKITIYQKKDTATKRYTLLHAKEILFYKQKHQAWSLHL